MKDHEKAQLVNDLKKEIMVLCPSAPAQLRAVISRVVNSHTNYLRFEMREDGSCSKCRENFAVCNGLCHDCLEEINPICYEPTSENEMTKAELIKALEQFENDSVVICMDSAGGWDNIEEVKRDGSSIAIVFGGGSPFSDA